MIGYLMYIGVCIYKLSWMNAQRIIFYRSGNVIMGKLVNTHAIKRKKYMVQPLQAVDLSILMCSSNYWPLFIPLLPSFHQFLTERPFRLLMWN